jgi:hypothetical protein
VAIVLGILFVLYGATMSILGSSRDATIGDYAVYGGLAALGVTLLVVHFLRWRSARRNTPKRRNRR